MPGQPSSEASTPSGVGTSRRLLVLVAAMAPIAGVAVGLVWRWHGLALGRGWLVAALTVVAVAAQMSPLLVVQRGEGAEVDVDEAVVVASLLLLPPGGVLVVALVSNASTQVLRRRGPLKGFYNIGVRVSAVAAGVLVAAAIAGPDAGHDSLRAVVAACAGAFTAGTLNTAMVWLVISLVTGLPLRHIGARWFHLDVYIMVLAILWGTLTAVASSEAVFALVLLMAPLVVIQQLYRGQRQRHRLETLLQTAASTAAAVRSGTVEEAIGTATRDALRTRVAEVREHPPRGSEIGRRLSTPDKELWLVADGAHQRDRFSSEDIALLDGLTAIASIALENQSLLDVVGRDPVTQLPFGALLVERVAAALADDRRPGLTAILVVKLLRFDLVKQTYGPEAAGTVLSELGRRLRQLAVDHPETARRPMSPGHLGDGEFAVVVEDVANREDALALARAVTDVLRRPVLLDGNDLAIEVSVGVALSGREPTSSTSTPIALLRDAITTASRIARVGGDPVQIAESGSGASVAARLGLERQLRHAMRHGQITVHYQPVIDVPTGAVAGAEALVRWEHPELGVLPPAEFVPLAEEIGLIVELDRLVLATACRQLGRWQRDRRCPEPFRLAVNLSARQLAEQRLVEAVSDVLEHTGVDAACLVLELTESSVMHDASSAAVALQALHDIGVRLAIDDFGTGYSSLAYLQDFAVDALKIDRSFIAGVTTRHADAEIVTATVGLAHSLGLQVVGEGVETEAQLDALRRLDCELAQGFLWSRPLPAAEFAQRWLRTGRDHMLAAGG